LKISWRSLISIIWPILFLAGCLPGEGPVSPPPWQYADLRLLASPGNGPASHQLVSLYTRRFRSEHQVRLDLLDFQAELDYDLYLTLDTTPGGSTHMPIQAESGLEWDLLVVVPASGSLKAYEPGGAVAEGVKLRVVRNPTLDTVVINLSCNQIHDPYLIQVYLTPKDSLAVASSLGPVRSDAMPPKRLPVMLAFWRTFPAYTPAQALRRYDGAHAGPASDRHGLRGLLDAIAATRFPAVLLDIKSPTTLSALDFAGALPQLQDLATQDLLILPDQLPLGASPKYSFIFPAWVQVQAAANARQVGQVFGLSPSPLLYSDSFPEELVGNLHQQVGDYLLIISTQAFPQLSSSNVTAEPDSEIQPLSSSSSLTPTVSRWGAYIWIDLATITEALHSSIQATYSGPTLEIRRLLLAAATDPAAEKLVLLGGELAQTAWGNPQAAFQTLNYLISRTWIQPITKTDLLTLPAVIAQDQTPVESLPEDVSPQQSPVLNNPLGEQLASGLTAQQVQELLLAELKSAPNNKATRLAWQAYESLLTPPAISSPLLAHLRAAYFGQIGHLLAAAHWGSKDLQDYCGPVNGVGSCHAVADLDWDGEDEAILASESFFGVFETRGGYLALAFVRDQSGLSQIIAPSTQFMVGMGDPLSWLPDKGCAGHLVICLLVMSHLLGKSLLLTLRLNR
jgi:hypothetical protein